MKQRTLKRTFSFEGKGLHTGVFTHMTLVPSTPDSGIRFVRTDISPNVSIPALAENISSTARSTTISFGGQSVSTIEHIMSVLTGLGIDNVTIEVDNKEIPILDGSARPYLEAISENDIVEQDAQRKFIDLPETIEVKDEQSGAFLRIIPSDRPSFDLKVDFGSRVLGVQTASWDPSKDNYRNEVGPCRTFVFFHEIAYLAQQGLVKGGDVDNAIVIVEHPVTDDQIEAICTLLDKPKLSVNENGYLNNLELRFPNECGRHKLLDLIGDFALAGGYLNARVEAFKSGHTINARATKLIREMINK